MNVCVIQCCRYRLGDADSPGETSESEEEEEKPKASSKRKAESPEPGPSSKKPALTKTGSNVSYGGGRRCFFLYIE